MLPVFRCPSWKAHSSLPEMQAWSFALREPMNSIYVPEGGRSFSLGSTGRRHAESESTSNKSKK